MGKLEEDNDNKRMNSFSLPVAEMKVMSLSMLVARMEIERLIYTGGQNIENLIYTVVRVVNEQLIYTGGHAASVAQTGGYIVAFFLFIYVSKQIAFP